MLQNNGISGILKSINQINYHGKQNANENTGCDWCIDSDVTFVYRNITRQTAKPRNPIAEFNYCATNDQQDTDCYQNFTHYFGPYLPMNSNKGKLYLIPNVIADTDPLLVIPAHVLSALPHISHFLAENVRTTRRFLSSLKIFPSIEALSFTVLDKNTIENDIASLLTPLMNGHDMGVISESGCPGIADPGAAAVKYCHQQGITVVPLVGPSSILMALIASGLDGQRFAFNGYLPIDKKELRDAIHSYEGDSKRKSQTQIFIETPFRNNHILDALVKNLAPATHLTIALDITGKDEYIQTQTVADWQKHKPTLAKLPAVYLFLAR